MKKDEKINFLKDIEKIKNLIVKEGKYKVLSDFSIFFNKRIFFKVDENGNIEERKYNPIIILFAFENDLDKLSEYILRYSFPEEKQNIKKISRASNIEIKDLKMNLMKTLINCNLNFSKIFGKELFLRDKKEFFKILYTFSLMSNPKYLKIFYVYSLEKIFDEKGYDENIFSTVMTYISKSYNDFHHYLNSSNEEEELDINLENDDKKIYFKIFTEILTKYKFENKNRFKNTLKKHFENNFYLDENIKNYFNI